MDPRHPLCIRVLSTLPELEIVPVFHHKGGIPEAIPAYSRAWRRDVLFRDLNLAVSQVIKPRLCAVEKHCFISHVMKPALCGEWKRETCRGQICGLKLGCICQGIHTVGVMEVWSSPWSVDIPLIVTNAKPIPLPGILQSRGHIIDIDLRLVLYKEISPVSRHEVLQGICLCLKLCRNHLPILDLISVDNVFIALCVDTLPVWIHSHIIGPCGGDFCESVAVEIIHRIIYENVSVLNHGTVIYGLWSDDLGFKSQVLVIDSNPVVRNEKIALDWCWLISRVYILLGFKTKCILLKCPDMNIVSRRAIIIGYSINFVSHCGEWKGLALSSVLHQDSNLCEYTISKRV